LARQYGVNPKIMATKNYRANVKETFLAAYTCAKHLKTFKGLTPFEFCFQVAEPRGLVHG
jgi:hypothetical protein